MRCGLLLLVPSVTPSLRYILSTSAVVSEEEIGLSRVTEDMESENELMNNAKTHVTSRLCRVSGFMTEIMEIKAEDPKFHVLFIPGNPGVVPFYKDFLESLYEFLDGNEE